MITNLDYTLHSEFISCHGQPCSSSFPSPVKYQCNGLVETLDCWMEEYLRVLALSTLLQAFELGLQFKDTIFFPFILVPRDLKRVMGIASTLEEWQVKLKLVEFEHTITCWILYKNMYLGLIRNENQIPYKIYLAILWNEN